MRPDDPFVQLHTRQKLIAKDDYILLDQSVPNGNGLVVGLLSVFVAYGRWRLAPYRGSSHLSVLQSAS